MLRPPLPSLAPLRDPFVVLRLLHRRTTCGHRRFELLASCVHGETSPLLGTSSTWPHVLGGTHLLCSKLGPRCVGTLELPMSPEGTSSVCFFWCFLVHTLSTLVTIFSSMSL